MVFIMWIIIISNQNAVAIILSKLSRTAKSDVDRGRAISSMTKIANKGFRGIRGMVHHTKLLQNVHLFDNRVILRLFFSLLRFLSVLIFKHKNQTKRSLVIAHLIEYDHRLFGNRTFDFAWLTKLYCELDYVRLRNPCVRVGSIRYARFLSIDTIATQFILTICVK